MGAHVLDRAAIRRSEPLRQNYLDMVLAIAFALKRYAKLKYRLTLSCLLLRSVLLTCPGQSIRQE